MESGKVIHDDPYLSEDGSKRKLPNDAIFACAYHLNIGIDIAVEAAFLRRTKKTDELWIVAGCDPEVIMEIAGKPGVRQEALRHRGLLGMGRAFVAKREGEESGACAELLGLLFFARFGLYRPEKFLVAGIIDEATYYRVKGQVEREVDENRRKAREAETEIIEAARRLGLCPRPTGLDSRFWWANCPGKNHPLEIKAEDNLFFCGYCRRKGSVEELRALVEERQKL